MEAAFELVVATHMPAPTVGSSVVYITRAYKMTYHSILSGSFFFHLGDDGEKTRDTDDRVHPLHNHLNPTGDRLSSEMSRLVIRCVLCVSHGTFIEQTFVRHLEALAMSL